MFSRCIEGYNEGPKQQVILDSVFRELKDAVLAHWKLLASLHRIARNDKPRGVLPSRITARPRSRVLMTRQEIWVAPRDLVTVD